MKTRGLVFKQVQTHHNIKVNSMGTCRLIEAQFHLSQRRPQWSDQITQMNNTQKNQRWATFKNRDKILSKQERTHLVIRTVRSLSLKFTLYLKPSSRTFLCLAQLYLTLMVFSSQVVDLIFLMLIPCCLVINLCKIHFRLSYPTLNRLNVRYVKTGLFVVMLRIQTKE